MAWATYDPANSGSDIVLSNGNTTLDSIGAGQSRATIKVLSGTKHYWEVLTTHSGNAVIGIDDGSGNLNGFTGEDVHGWAFYQVGYIFHNDANVANLTEYGDANIIGVALDLVGNTIAFTINNVSAGAAYSIPGGSYFPACGAGALDTILTANFVGTALTYSPPAGFTAGVGNLPQPQICTNM